MESGRDMMSLQVCWAIPLLNRQTDQDLEHRGPQGPEVTALEVKVKNLDIYADAQWSCILLKFLPLDCLGDQGNPCQSTFQSGWQSTCGHRFSFDFCYISHYYQCIPTPLLDILISEEVQHLDSFDWGQNKSNQQLWEYMLWGRKQQTMKRNWMQYVLGIPSQSHLCE